MTFTESKTVEQMILDAAGVGPGGELRPTLCAKALLKVMEMHEE